MKNVLVLILYMIIGANAEAQSGIEIQNKRLSNALKKYGSPDFLQFKEIHVLKTLDETNGKFFEAPAGEERRKVKYLYVGRVNSCRAGGCNLENTASNGESEYFDYFILFNSSKTVLLVNVYNYQATHGYEITAKGWLKQFVGYEGKDTLLVNKQIDGITGATISVVAITADVQQKTKLLAAMNN